MSVAAKSGDLDEFLRHDVHFHRTLMLASGNEMFAGLANVVAEVLHGRADHHLMPQPPERSAVDMHIEVATAVQSGDAAAARRAMTDILDDTEASLILASGAPMATGIAEVTAADLL